MEKFWENFKDMIFNEALPAVCLFLLFGGVWIGLMCFFVFLLNLVVGG